MEALLAVTLETALAKNWHGGTALEALLATQPYLNVNVALCLLENGPPPLQQSSRLLSLQAREGDAALPLYPALVARQPLTPQQWAEVPVPCHGLGTVLPAVLERSVQEAALLVRCLPAADRQRLRTFALCLARTQGHLPTPLVWHLLTLVAS